MPEAGIYKIALNSISAHVAIIDKNGVILETNRAWKEFACANGLSGNPDSTGENYITVCENASRAPNDESAVIAQGIRKVISGDFKEFFINYPCHSQQEERWFALRVVPLRDGGSRKVVLTHEDITPLIEIQRSLAKKEKMLRDQTEKLQESNIALKVLLKHREKDQLQLEETMLGNVRELILPYVNKLLDSGIKGRERALTEIIRDRLEEIISPFLKRLSSLHTVLTPQEIQVATLVRDGRSSKEIAEIMTLSLSAVAFHRKQIRKKLKMTGSGNNLRSYLLSLQ